MYDLCTFFVIFFLLLPGFAKAQQEQHPSGETCSTGLRKCDPLRDNALEYWWCMDKTCKDPALANADPECTRGRQSCAGHLTDYWGCMTNMCPQSQSGKSISTCETGTKMCGDRMNNYWQCVNMICLGTLEQQYAPKVFTSDIYDTLIKSRPKGFTELSDAPVGVAQPSRISCPEGTYMSCKGGYLANCTCSDGSRPVDHALQEYQEKKAEMDKRARTGNLLIIAE